MSLLPAFNFPTYFSIKSCKAEKGVLMTFTSQAMGNAQLALDKPPNMSNLLDLLPKFEQSGMVRMFAKIMKLPSMFEFKAEPIDGKARVSLIVLHATKKAKTWSRDFDQPSITIKDLVDFKDLLVEGIAYQRS